eukprot:scaffold296856_cov19-Tisochrysis_lutea.AAC.2
MGVGVGWCGRGRGCGCLSEHLLVFGLPFHCHAHSPVLPPRLQLETVQKEDKKYKSTMQVVTVEPAGLSSDHASKARVLIVSAKCGRLSGYPLLSAAQSSFHRSLAAIWHDGLLYATSPQKNARLLSCGVLLWHGVAFLLQDYGEHAREFISAELGLRLLQVLADPAAVIRAVGDVQRGQHIVTLLDRVVFTVRSKHRQHALIQVKIRPAGSFSFPAVYCQSSYPVSLNVASTAKAFALPIAW